MSQRVPVTQVSNAWKHMRAVVREDEKPSDLYDLLQNSARDASVAPQIPGVRWGPSRTCSACMC